MLWAYSTSARVAAAALAAALALGACDQATIGGAAATRPSMAVDRAASAMTPAASTKSAARVPAGGGARGQPALAADKPAQYGGDLPGGPVAASDLQDGAASDEVSDGAAKNIVRLVNKKDNRLRIKGKVQLNHIPGQNASPENLAVAYASCTDCQTFAVALQIDLISKTATTIAPKNAAVAINYRCTGCTTVARAFQYVYQVDDPTEVPDDASNLVKQMNQRLQTLHSSPPASATDAEAQINAVIAQFQQLAASLNDQRDAESAPDTPNAQPVDTGTDVTQ